MWLREALTYVLMEWLVLVTFWTTLQRNRKCQHTLALPQYPQVWSFPFPMIPKNYRNNKGVGKNSWKIVSVYFVTSNECSFLWNKSFPEIFNPLIPKPTKWSNTLKQFVGNRSEELFECVWPFCGVGAYRVRILTLFISYE